MTNAMDDLHATAEDLAADAERLRQIEERKATMDSDDPALPELAAEAEGLSKEMASKARVQRELADSVTDEGAPGSERRG